MKIISVRRSLHPDSSIVSFDNGCQLLVDNPRLFNRQAFEAAIGPVDAPADADWVSFIKSRVTTAPPIQSQAAPALSTRGSDGRFTERSIASAGPATVNESARTVEATLATNAVTPVADWSLGVVDEVLDLDNFRDLPDRIPLLDSHRRDSVSRILGSVTALKVRDGKLLGRLHFSDDPDGEAAWRKVKGGDVSSVSLGYLPTQSTDIQAGKSGVVNGRSYTAGMRTLRITSQATVKEASLVAIPADGGATIRTGPDGFVRTGALPENVNRMDALQAGLSMRLGAEPADEKLAEVGHAYENYSLVSLAREALRMRGMTVAESDRTVVRDAVESGTLTNILANTIDVILQKSFGEAPDTTAGWIEEVSKSRFAPTPSASFGAVDSLDAIPRGGTSNLVQLTDNAGPSWGVSRFGKSLVISEDDFLDDSLNSLTDIPAMIGAASGRVRPDWIFYLILSNAVMADGTALFDASRSNYRTMGAGLGVATVQDAITAIRNQTSNGVTLNLQPRYLVVPSELERVGRETLRALELSGNNGDSNLILRVEPRLSAGAVHPVTKAKAAGNAAGWLVVAEQSRALLAGYLFGQRKPVVRMATMKQGQWGWRADIVYDFGAAVGSDHRGIYYSAV